MYVNITLIYVDNRVYVQCKYILREVTGLLSHISGFTTIAICLYQCFTISAKWLI